MKKRVWTHGAIAAAWVASAVPAWLWWRDSVLFVIAASIFANVYAAVSALEAADDSTLRAELAEVRELVEKVLDQQS